MSKNAKEKYTEDLIKIGAEKENIDLHFTIIDSWKNKDLVIDRLVKEQTPINQNIDNFNGF